MSNFKKSVLATALISSAFISQVFAADEGNGRIHFTGTVINAPCSIAPNSTDINVDLGQVSNKVLETGNKHSENVSYNIDLQDCDLSEQTAGSVTYPAMSKVSVTFGGVSDASAAALLANTGSATGAGIRLIDANGALLKVGDTSADINLISGINQIAFAARVEATGTAVKAGTIVSQATYALNYK
ncbi:fimbrial protein [Yersinia nurmii]|uniref:Fimbrial protein n=1 Tax=Yersinia nurmii TaxID=685706 RepID=A0AAW7K1M8_9GAMM|nr:fimbrial protein [Yersinia nurmii]MDN0089023.1 fimbrial protein [Yersinia nurmii]CNE74397.1 fimbrial protein [Yersinia nurmii]